MLAVYSGCFLTAARVLARRPRRAGSPQTWDASEILPDGAWEPV